jgi:hypothetical protein
MKTDQLVELLARDTTQRQSPGRSLLVALLPAGFVTATGFCAAGGAEAGSSGCPAQSLGSI